MKPESISAVGKLMLVLAVALALVAVATPRAHAQTFSVVHNFTGGSDGANPLSCFTIDGGGTRYGNSNGTVFSLALHRPSGYKVLYSFRPGIDGRVPVAGVTLDAAGNLYGTTAAGGTYGYGTVFQLKFKVTPSASDSGWTESILHNFQNTNDGAVPYAGLIFDQSGNLYGAATEGGAGTNGGGTIFKLAPSQSGWTFTVLYRLPGSGISGTFRNLIM